MMYTEALKIIEQLTALEVDDQVTQLQGEEIAAMFGGDRSLFIELDERPGQFDIGYPSHDWHWKLRQARNGCTRFFDVFVESPLQAALRVLRQECEYHPEDEGSVDALIGYKDALEDLVGEFERKAAAWDAIDKALTRNASGEGHASAADVCAQGFAIQERLSGHTPKWRAVRMRNGRLLEPVEGVGDVGALVLYPEPGGHLVLVIDENSGRAQFTDRVQDLGVSVDG